MTDKTVERIQQTHNRHWVGDGFPVRTLFAYPGTGQEL
ncbi:MAG: pirin family protein, partial [Planctomycetota bacterium]